MQLSTTYCGSCNSRSNSRAYIRLIVLRTVLFRLGYVLRSMVEWEPSKENEFVEYADAVATVAETYRVRVLRDG